jgi:drug/metabolite transporter (DMT)-like permease
VSSFPAVEPSSGTPTCTSPQRKRTSATALGLVAIILWGTTIAVSRRATEQLGTFTSAAALCLLAGAIGCGHLLATRRLGRVLRQFPRKYLFGCGSLVMAYTVLLYTAIGWSTSPRDIVAVTVANYLWPGLTLVFSVPLLGQRTRAWLLVIGMTVSTIGVACAVGAYDGDGNGGLRIECRGPAMAAVLAAVAWGLYSNLSRRWARDIDGGAMFLFLAAAGGCLLLIRLVVSEPSSWSARTIAEIGYLAIFPTLLACTFWDRAVRCGNMMLLAAVSYLIPLLSVWTSSVYLGLSIRPIQWLAALLVVCGAICCKLAMR